MRLALCLASLAACRPTLPDGVFACDSRSDCPSGWDCSSGYCYEDAAGDARREGADTLHPGADAAQNGDTASGDSAVAGDAAARGDEAPPPGDTTEPPTCTTATCQPFVPCQSATCQNGVCARVSTCNLSQTCCQGACVPLGCSDDNPCTDNACAGSGCEHRAAIGRSCGAAPTACSLQDTCDGSGLCQPNNVASGDEGACPMCQDCDGAGNCANVPSGESDAGCDAAATACSGQDSCWDGTCQLDDYAAGTQTLDCRSDGCSERSCSGDGACTISSAGCEFAEWRVTSEPCGRCGNYWYYCYADCSEWPECFNEGECTPGSVECTAVEGPGGTSVRRCSDACSWGEWSVESNCPR